MQDVVIFRHNLFRVSEPFITQQAEQMRRHRPVYLGRLRYGEPPLGAASLALADARSRWTLPAIGLQMLTRDPRPYQRLLAGHKPALIHAHFGIDGVYALPLARRLKIPLVTTFHGFDATLSQAAMLCSPAWANFPLFRHQLARHGDLFLCVSSFIRDQVIRMGFPAERTQVHYTGVNCAAHSPRTAAEETRTILHVGRLVAMKGTAQLIRAFAMLSARNADARLVIIGGGPLEGSLKAMTRSLGLAPRTLFLGALPHDQVLAWMRQAAMLVLPSVRTAGGRTEGLGMVTLEAAAIGVPVIGSTTGGIPESVEHGRTGFLVPERDARTLAERMDELLDNPALRRAFGAAARARVEAKFDLVSQTEALEHLYDVVQQSSRRLGASSTC